jgi:hypothetical protein
LCQEFRRTRKSFSSGNVLLLIRAPMLHLFPTTLVRRTNHTFIFLPCDFQLSLCTMRLKYCVTIDWVWIGEWIFDHLYTQLITTSNYSAISNLHNSQIIAPNTKYSPASNDFTSRFLVMASNYGHSSVVSSLDVSW